MPVLPNNKHELFAQGLAKGLSADAAYQAAGYKPHRGNAARLRANEIIQRRTAEILGKAAEKAEVNKAWVMAR
jgi:phage terminase small subunit